MRANAVMCLVVAVVFAGLALAAFGGRTVAREFLSIRQTAEQTVVAWVERVIPEKTASPQIKIDTKYKQELARARERLKSIEMEREKLETRVAEMEKQRAKQDWRSVVIANTSSIMSGVMVTLSAIFGSLAYWLQKRTPRPGARAASSRSLSDRLSSPLDQRAM
jgi:hypothetical protein